MKERAAMLDHDRRPWTFLTSHARVLIIISQNPNLRVRDIAAIAGLTERSTQRIVADLEAAGYLSHERIGRRNHYTIRTTETLRHPHEQSVEIGLLLELFSNALGGATHGKVHR
jgi:DNA-binding MarR family transcriptional regulator